MAMHTWFECKIRYEKTMENGMQKANWKSEEVRWHWRM